MAKETKLNRPLIEKMIARMTEKPEAYDQGVVVASLDDLRVLIKDGDALPRPDPQCGAAGCLIAQTIICNAPTVAQGIATLKRLDSDGDAEGRAAKLLGMPFETAWSLFFHWKDKWPEPYRTRFVNAKTYRGQASAAVALLRAILRTDGKILERRLR